jgi:hypothetical protein
MVLPMLIQYRGGLHQEPVFSEQYARACLNETLRVLHILINFNPMKEPYPLE